MDDMKKKRKRVSTFSILIFQYVNRPHSDISFHEMLEGLVRFRAEYTGHYWLEVFILAGINTTEKEITRLKTWISAIGPDKVQINTVTRPPAEGFAEAVPKKQLITIAKQLHENAEVIADYITICKQKDLTSQR